MDISISSGSITNINDFTPLSPQGRCLAVVQRWIDKKVQLVQWETTFNQEQECTFFLSPKEIQSISIKYDGDQIKGLKMTDHKGEILKGIDLAQDSGQWETQTIPKGHSLVGIRSRNCFKERFAFVCQEN